MRGKQVRVAEEKMETDLESVERQLRIDPRLRGFEIRSEGEELHLEKHEEKFARLSPSDMKGEWRMETFQETEEWEIGSFSGTLEECLDFLTTHPRYQFWER